MRPSALFITHVLPFPPRAGNELRIHNLLRWFRGAGYRIVLLLSGGVPEASVGGLTELVDTLYFAGDTGGPSIRAPLSAAGRYALACARAKVRGMQARDTADSEAPLVRILCSPELVERTRRIVAVHQPAVVVAQYIGMSPCLEEAGPPALKMIDTIDVFSERPAKVVQQGLADPYACTPDQERKALLRADVILGIQPDEARLLHRLVPERETIIVGVDFEASATLRSVSDVPPTVMIVASSNPMNVQGVSWFLEEAWPEIHRRCPGAILRILGPVGDVLKTDAPGVQVCGRVADLGAEYARAIVVVNPTRMGTGLKIKTIEALAHGKCLVSWPNGVEGIAVDGNAPFCVERSTEGFVAIIATLLSDTSQRRTFETRAREYSAAHFSPQVVYAELDRCLQRKGLRPEPHAHRRLA